MKKGKILGYWDYTVVLTYLGMVFAFIGILEVLNLKFANSLVLLLLAGLCDMFDGAVASTKQRDVYARHFGVQIDSLSDLISFGVLPALFVYMHSGKNFYVGILSCVYLLSALVRLAYYNVQEIDRQSKTDDPRETLTGVPVTTVAPLLPLIYLIYSLLGKESEYNFIIITCVLAVGFVCTHEFKKPRLAGKIVVIFISLAEIIGAFIMSGVGL